MKKRIRRIVIVCVRLFGAAGAHVASWRIGHADPEQVRILLIRTDYPGDLLLTSPELGALKTHARGAHITLLVCPWPAEVFERHSGIDQLLVCPFPNLRRRSPNRLEAIVLLVHIVRRLRRGDYHLAITLRHNYWWGVVLLYLTRIPHRIGYAVEPFTGTPFLSLMVPSQPREHVAVSALRLIDAGSGAVGYQPLEKPYTPDRYHMAFKPSAEEQRWVDERLKREGIATWTPVVVIQPGTSVEVQQWRPDGWAQCASKIVQASLHAAPIRNILTGSSGERALLERIVAGIPTPTTRMTEMTVGQLAALLQRARLVLGVDSAPLHLAAAQGVPTIRIFGPTDPRRCGSWGPHEEHTCVVSTHRCQSCPTSSCGRLDFRAQELDAHSCVREGRTGNSSAPQ